ETGAARFRRLNRGCAMSWDFETDPDYQKQLDWADEFVRERVEPLDMLWPGLVFTPPAGTRKKLLDELKQEVRDRGMWATHLGPELGGLGHGQLKLSLLNEILGRSQWAPVVFGCQAPDTGNAEIIAHYGTPEQKARFLQPLLDGELFSCYAMTEPQAGADPTMFETRARKDGDEWVIEGWKYFSSNAPTAAFYIVMVVTDPDVSAYQGMSMFLVPSDTPGIEIVRNVGLAGEPLGEGSHGLVQWNGVRVPTDALLGGEGQAFAIAQTRLGGGRIHHAMRTIGLANKAIDMMCERALSRETQGELLAKKQFVQGYIADSYAQLAQFRLLVLYTAWSIDKHNDYRKVRKDIAAIKVLMPQVLHDIAQRSVQVHGALGVSNEMPLHQMILAASVMGLADGPTEVHKVTVARQVLRDHEPSDDLWPTQHLPRRLAAARAQYADYLDDEARS
ncbi:MAG: acyl-CoA dehydrogenase family protein, partial [Acidimicrobiales bacterium]